MHVNTEIGAHAHHIDDHPTIFPFTSLTSTVVIRIGTTFYGHMNCNREHLHLNPVQAPVQTGESSPFCHASSPVKTHRFAVVIAPS